MAAFDPDSSADFASTSPSHAAPFAPPAGRDHSTDSRGGRDRGIVASARAVGKAYRVAGEASWVLRDVDFEVLAGECVFLCGPSGSGKSTLLSILGCLLTPDSGTVQIHGRDTRGLSADELTRTRRDLIGFVFQRFQLIRGITAEDNVALPLALQGVPAAEACRRARDLLDRVGLAAKRRSKPDALSPGQCQRVALARAVIHSPKLVLADEPTAALDGTSGGEVMALLRELVRFNNAAAVVVTHDPRIVSYADRVCEIDSGRLSSAPTPGPDEASPPNWGSLKKGGGDPADLPASAVGSHWSPDSAAEHSTCCHSSRPRTRSAKFAKQRQLP